MSTFNTQRVMDVLNCKRLWAYVVLDYLEQNLGNEFYEEATNEETKAAIKAAHNALNELMK